MHIQVPGGCLDPEQPLIGNLDQSYWFSNHSVFLLACWPSIAITHEVILTSCLIAPRAAPFFTDRVTDRRYKENPPGRSVGPPGTTSTGYQLLPEKAFRSVK